MTSSTGSIRKQPICVWLREFSNKADVLNIKFDDKSKLIELELESIGGHSHQHHQTTGCIHNTRNDSHYYSTNHHCTAVIRYSDVVGAHLVKGKFPSDNACYLRLFVYPYRGGSIIDSTAQNCDTNNGHHNGEPSDECRTCGHDHPRRRRRKVYTLKFTMKRAVNNKDPVIANLLRNNCDDNDGIKEGDNWMNAKFYLDQVNFRCSYACAFPKTNRRISETRKLIVFVNPFAGPGKALHIFRQKVLPVFAEANIQCRLVVTERQNQVFDSIKKLNIYEWDGVIIVSGDGLVFELLNGLAARDDRESALKVPIGMVPGGSGNGLAAACCFEPSDSCKFDYAMDAAVLIAKPNYADMKLAHVQTRNQHMISFMSVGWGLLADIDIESEKFRKLLGSARFIAGGLVRWANLRVYKGRISFKLAPHRKRDEYNANTAVHTADPIPPNSNKDDNDLLAKALAEEGSALFNQLASRFPSLANNQLTGKSRSADEALLEVMAQDVANLSNYYRCSKSCNELAVALGGGTNCDNNFDELACSDSEDNDEDDEGCYNEENCDQESLHQNRLFMNNNDNMIRRATKLFNHPARFTNSSLKIFTNLLNNLETNPSFFDNDRIIREKCMMDNGSILCKLDENFCDATSFKRSSSIWSTGSAAEKECSYAYMDSLQMPKLSEPVPSDWTVIEDEFVMVYVIYLSHIASDMPYMPKSTFDDDLMYLTLIRASRCSRLDLLRFLSTMDAGKHLDSRCVEVYPITAFRLERLSESGVVTVDGEDTKCDGPIQACLSKLKATVMTARKSAPVSKL